MSQTHQTDIVACTKCDGHVAIDIPAAGTVSPKDRWTDGWGSNALHSPVNLVFNCPHCHRTQIRGDAPLVGSVKVPSTFNCEHALSMDAIAPSFEDFMSILESNPTPLEEELNIRIEAWQFGNHSRRDAKHVEDFGPGEINNLQALRTLLNDNEIDQRLLRAEILRELGEFEASMNLLSKDYSDEYDPVLSRLRELNQLRDRFVAQIVPGGPKHGWDEET